MDTAAKPRLLPGEESGWLIEKKEGPPCWLLTWNEHGAIWTPDSLRAMRFARKDDAAALIGRLALAGCDATEHLWCAAPPPKPSAREAFAEAGRQAGIAAAEEDLAEAERSIGEAIARGLAMAANAVKLHRFEYERLGGEIGRLVASKQAAYGDAFGRSRLVLEALYPVGVQPEQYADFLALVRVVDKLFRIATDRDAFGESPWRDIAGYALLATARVEASREPTFTPLAAGETVPPLADRFTPPVSEEKG